MSDIDTESSTSEISSDDLDAQIRQMERRRDRMIEEQNILRTEISIRDEMIEANNIRINEQRHQLVDIKKRQTKIIWHRDEELSREELEFTGNAAPILIEQRRNEFEQLKLRALQEGIRMDIKPEQLLRANRTQFITETFKSLAHEGKMDLELESIGKWEETATIWK